MKQDTPRPIETVTEVETSEDSGKTLIFSRPKQKTPSKSTVSQKGIASKIILRKTTTTSTIDPSNKGKGVENLPTEKPMQDEPKNTPVKKNDPNVLLRLIHTFIL